MKSITTPVTLSQSLQTKQVSDCSNRADAVTTLNYCCYHCRMQVQAAFPKNKNSREDKNSLELEPS